MSQIDLQPTLVGPHLLVRPVSAEDWSEMFAAASDPLTWALHPISDRYTEPVFREFFDGALASGSAFSLVDRASGRIVGSSRYNGHDPDRREIEIGWTFLARDCWGGDANREVKQLMLDHAFGFVDTVIFLVGETNLRSRGAMTKIGGVLRPGIIARTLNGATHNHLVYEIRRDDWRRSRPAIGPG
jgi:N-acetyltransferase